MVTSCFLSLGSLHEQSKNHNIYNTLYTEYGVQCVINIVIFATVTSHVYDSEGMKLGQYLRNIGIKDWLSWLLHAY